MANLRTLNSRERKRLLARLERQYGVPAAALDGYALLHQEAKGRYHIAEPAAANLPLAELRVESVGFYLCAELGNGELRLSIEGSQLLGPHATRNVLALTDEEFHEWIRGRDVERETPLEGFLILRHGEDFCGAGKPVRDQKSGRLSIHNYLPKTRYVRREE